MANITKKTIEALSKAHSHFNKHLFKGRLPDAAIILARKKNSYSYYRHNRFQTAEGSLIDEIGINPDYISELGDSGVATALIMAMISQWQQVDGQKKGRDNYHNAEWASMAISLGLAPTGKATGQKVSYIALPDGRFMDALEALSPEDLDAISSSVEPSKPVPDSKKKFRHTCPSCGQSCWGSKTGQYLCGLREKHQTGEIDAMIMGYKFDYAAARAESEEGE